MADLWIVQVSAEADQRAFNVIVWDDVRTTAELTAEAAVRAEGWADVRAMRSGLVAEDRLSERGPEFQRAAAAAKERGWAMIVYQPTN